MTIATFKARSAPQPMVSAPALPQARGQHGPAPLPARGIVVRRCRCRSCSDFQLGCNLRMDTPAPGWPVSGSPDNWRYCSAYRGPVEDRDFGVIERGEPVTSQLACDHARVDATSAESRPPCGSFPASRAIYPNGNNLPAR